MTGKIYLFLAFLFVLGASNALVGFKAYQFGANSVQVKWDREEQKRISAVAAANEAILKKRPKVKHENQNRDHSDLVAYGCQRGWVRDFENCPGKR